MENMNNFKKSLQVRIILLTVFMIFLLIVYIFSFQMIHVGYHSSQGLENFKTGIQFGLGVGLYAVILALWAKAFRAIRNPKKLKLLYIAEHDERKLLIRQKSGFLSVMIILAGLVVGIVVAGTLDDTVFLTLLGTCFFVCFVHAGLKLYYLLKY